MVKMIFMYYQFLSSGTNLNWFFSGINLRKLAVLNILIVTHLIQKFGLRRHLSALYSGEIVNQVSKSGQLNKEKQKAVNFITCILLPVNKLNTDQSSSICYSHFTLAWFASFNNSF